MHALNRSCAATLLCIATSISMASDATSPPPVIYLDGLKSLEALRQANPAHYARAERIIAAANELCRPGSLENAFAQFSASEVSCTDSLLKTSNPPKKQLSFKLDRTRYVALVAITDDPARVTPAHN